MSEIVTVVYEIPLVDYDTTRKPKYVVSHLVTSYNIHEDDGDICIVEATAPQEFHDAVVQQPDVRVVAE